MSKTQTEPTVEQFRKLIEGISDGLYKKIRNHIPHTVNQGQVVPEVEYAEPEETCKKCGLPYREHPRVWTECYFACNHRVYRQPK